MDKKLDLRKNNGGKGNVGRKAAIVKRVSITPRVIRETVTFLREGSVRLGLSQGEVLDAWAKLAKTTTKTINNACILYYTVYNVLHGSNKATTS